jgi:hypothetical protein
MVLADWRTNHCQLTQKYMHLSTDIPDYVVRRATPTTGGRWPWKSQLPGHCSGQRRPFQVESSAGYNRGMEPNPYQAPKAKPRRRPWTFWGTAFRCSLGVAVFGVVAVQLLVMASKRWSLNLYDDGPFSAISQTAARLLIAGVISTAISAIGLAGNWLFWRKKTQKASPDEN